MNAGGAASGAGVSRASLHAASAAQRMVRNAARLVMGDSLQHAACRRWVRRFARLYAGAGTFR
jgi:hypothetical protein